jgi:imidazolonepropionase-like amidohydrolase
VKKDVSYPFLLVCIVISLFLRPCLSEQTRTLAIQGGRIQTVRRGIIENGTLLIKSRKIVSIGKNIQIPRDSVIIKASGLYVLPGFIDAFSNIGTAEVGSVDQDYDEATSPLTPQLRIIDGINPENRFVRSARKSGITMTLCVPGEDNLLSGQSALIHLKGKTVSDMIISFPAGMHGNFGEGPLLRYGQKGVYPATRMGEVALIRKTLIETQTYLEKIQTYHKNLAAYEKKAERSESALEGPPLPVPTDFKLEALVPVLKGSVPLVVSADRMSDILSAIRIADEFHIPVVLSHGAEAHRVAERLATRNIPVILGPLADMNSRLENANASYENAFLLRKAGVHIAFQTGFFNHYADLLDQARIAVSYGLPYEEALDALTYSPARIFGVQDRFGSLEEGKVADVLIFEGDPIRTPAKLKMVIIDGEIVEDFF